MQDIKEFCKMNQMYFHTHYGQDFKWLTTSVPGWYTFEKIFSSKQVIWIFIFYTSIFPYPTICKFSSFSWYVISHHRIVFDTLMWTSTWKGLKEVDCLILYKTKLVRCTRTVWHLYHQYRSTKGNNASYNLLPPKQNKKYNSLSPRCGWAWHWLSA
jgi:hypothetical protein